MLNRSHSILVVDDEPVNLRMLERLLRRKFEVITATSGEMALEILKGKNVSMIITDQRMPGISGTELLRKSRAYDPDIVRILVTANSDTDTFIDALQNSGAVRVISKPWDPDKVMQAITSALEKYELMADNRQAMSRLRLVSEELNKIARRE